MIKKIVSESVKHLKAKAGLTYLDPFTTQLESKEKQFLKIWIIFSKPFGKLLYVNIR